MTLLCIETSTAVCSAAVCRDGQLLKQLINREGSNHARLLPLYIDELLAYVREQGLMIDAVALSEGPGSYTGLRIGTSMAKGLCYGLNVPLIPVPTLEVLCEAAKEKFAKSQEPRAKSLLVPMIDARRMEVYITVSGEGLAVSGAKAVVVENEESVLCQCNGLYSDSEAVYYFGDGAEKCTKVLTKPNWHFVQGIVPEAQYVGMIGDRLAVSGEGRVESRELAYYEPFYLKEFIAAQSHVKGLK